MKPRICIIVEHQNINDTLQCLASLFRLNYRLYTAAVVATGEAVETIRATFPRAPIFETNQNDAIRWALSKPFKWILLLGSDTVADPDLLVAFMQTAQEIPQAKILGAKIRNQLGEKWIPEKAAFEPAMCEPIDCTNHSALLMHRSVPEAIGPPDPRLCPYWAAADFCTRARRMGFEVRAAPNATVERCEPSLNAYLWWRGRLLWMRRNLPERERRALRPILRAEIFKRQPIRQRAAALFGALHYALGKFGRCPKWL